MVSPGPPGLLQLRQLRRWRFQEPQKVGLALFGTAIDIVSSIIQDVRVPQAMTWIFHQFLYLFVCLVGWLFVLLASLFYLFGWLVSCLFPCFVCFCFCQTVRGFWFDLDLLLLERTAWGSFCINGLFVKIFQSTLSGYYSPYYGLSTPKVVHRVKSLNNS